jgi:hypothetical protein
VASIKTTDEFFTTARALIDAWCDQRRLAPLAVLLPAYLDPNPLTDGWHARYDALKTLRVSCKDELSDAELEAVNELIRFAEQVTYRDRDSR